MQSDSDSEGEFYDAADTQWDVSAVVHKQASDSKDHLRSKSNTSDEKRVAKNAKEKNLNLLLESERSATPTDTSHPRASHKDNSIQPIAMITDGSYQAELADQSLHQESVGQSLYPCNALQDSVGSIIEVSKQEADTPPPVAPPRRKRKKKLADKAAIDATDETDGSTKPSCDVPCSDASSTPAMTTPIDTTIPLSVDATGLPSDNAAAGITATELNSLLDKVEDDDPSIQLDYKSQEMKEVLAKASSTEVIPALTLDSRLKSHSVTSLGSSGNRSDSFMSVASNTSNGPMHKSGSFASVGSVHSYQQTSAYGEMVRAKSASGRPLSDIEILEQVLVKNLDTGESIPLSLAEERLPKGTNPLALHIMRLTSEYHSNSNISSIDQEDGIDVGRKVKKKTKKLKKFLGRTVNKMKVEKKVKEMAIKEGKEGRENLRSEESSSSDEDSVSQETPTPYIKIKSSHGKGPEEFEKLKLLQDLSGEHVGAVWTIKFSVCGRLMATAGQDHMVRVWVLKECQESFEEMRTKYSKPAGSTSSNTNSEEALVLSEQDEDEAMKATDEEDKETKDEETDKAKEKKEEDEDSGPFQKTPFCTYCGHTGDVLDLSWSKNYFLLSSSMDKTVRLWHISRTECLCCFQHIDFVTAIVFHPRDDRYFLSGSLDGKIRLWNIPDKKVALWNEVEGAGSNLITAANFCLQGRFAVVGTYDGRCIFYETERLKYHTQWQVRSSRNKRGRGRKISGIEPMPGEEKVLITSNDSRIRLYDLKDNSLYCKYKGCTNTSSQIKASFSHDGQYLVCGSEDHFVYIWRTQHGIPSSRRDKNEFYESFSAHDAVVTAAIFAPVPWLVVEPDQSGSPVSSEVLVTADWGGAIKLFVNR